SPLPIQALPSKQVDSIQLDPRGRKVPRGDRWEDTKFEWEAPTLPSSELPPPGRAAAGRGPFAHRLTARSERRPEAPARLCAAAEARWVVKGEESVVHALSTQLSSNKCKNFRAPPEHLARLTAIERDVSQPKPWRTVARLLLERLPQIASR